MRARRKISGLIAVNIALLAILGLITWAPATQAESGSGAGSQAGDYIMLGGDVTGMTSNGIYVLDQRSGILIALQYELGRRKLKALNARNIIQDARRSGSGR